MSEVTLTWYNENQVVGPTTIYGVSIEDTVNKMVIPLIFAKSIDNRTSATGWRVLDLNRNERLITVTGKIDNLNNYYQLKTIRAIGGTCRFTYSQTIDTFDSDWDSTRSCLHLVITSCTITETAQDRVDSSESPIFDVVFTGRVAARDEKGANL